MNTQRPAASAGSGLRSVQKGQPHAHLASPRQPQSRANFTSPRQAQTFAHLASPRQAETSATRTTRRVVTGPNGRPMEVMETEQRTTKRTIWTRVFSGSDKTKTKTSQPGKYKFWQRTGNKNTNTHAAKTGTNSAGFNLRYYRETFATLPRQTQFDLYMAGMAPLMTYLEHRRFKSRVAGMRVMKAYRPVPVMYAAQEAPSGFAAPPKNLRLEAKIAKERDAARAVRRKGAATAAAASTATTSTAGTAGTTGANAAAKRRRVVKRKENAEEEDEDALPAFPTPVMYQQEMKKQTRVATGKQPLRQQQRQKQKAKQAQAPEELLRAKQRAKEYQSYQPSHDRTTAATTTTQRQREQQQPRPLQRQGYTAYAKPITNSATVEAAATRRVAQTRTTATSKTHQAPQTQTQTYPTRAVHRTETDLGSPRVREQGHTQGHTQVYTQGQRQVQGQGTPRTGNATRRVQGTRVADSGAGTSGRG